MTVVPRRSSKTPRIQNELVQLPLRSDVIYLLNQLSVFSSLVILLIGTTVLTGWILNNELLKRIYPPLLSMKANTSISFIFLGLSIFLSQFENKSKFFKYLRLLTGAIAALIGALTLSQYITGVDFNIDQMFFKEEPGVPGTASPNRMAPNSALLFSLLGLSLLFLDKKIKKTWITHSLLIASSIILLPSLMGYAYGIDFIYGLATTTKMSLPAAIAFSCSTIGILLARPLNGFVSVLIRDDAGGYLARRLILTSILLPLLLGFLILHGYQIGLYDVNFRYLLLIGSCVILFTFLIFRNAFSLSHADANRKKAEAVVSHMAAIVQASDDAIISRTIDGGVLSWNKGAEKTYGYTEEEMQKTKIDVLLPKGYEKELQKISKKLIKKERIDHLETIRVKKDGTKINVSISFSPITDNKGKVIAISTIARDITDQKNAEKLLQMRVKQQAVVAELGFNALSGISLQRLFDIAVKKLADTLGVEYTKILELRPGEKNLLLRAGYGWKKSVKKNISTVDIGNNSQGGYTLMTKKPVIVKDLRTDKRFNGPPLLTDHKVVSGMSCIIHGSSNPFGVLGVHTTSRRDFTGNDIHFLQSVANLLAMTIERKELERQKNDFISIASHELKTPVTSIKSFGQVLQLRFLKEGNRQSAELIAKMDSQINKLTNLIGDLLDVTKIETGKIQYNSTKFSFDNLVSETIEEMQRTTEKHKLILKGSTKKTITADRERLGQVLTNLISNAIKYSPNTDKIIIHSTLEKDSIKFCVQDFGVGIPKDKKEQVFERFFRISGPGKETFPGLGLGLYISSEIVKRQGGRIWVDSVEGKGSTFCFRLPHTLQNQKLHNKLQVYNNAKKTLTQLS